MEGIKFRELRADELEVRQSAKKDGYVSLLIYKDSRCDMRVLDETVGSENWEVDYKREGDTLLCGLSIYSDKHQRFLTKWAAGSESNIEAVKGEQSDSLKRAAFAWGLGRALYTAPKINVPENQAYGKLTVKEIKYEDEKIVALTIVNGRGNVIYNFPGGANTRFSTEEPEAQKTNKTNAEKLKDFCTGKKGTEDTKVLKKFYEFYCEKINSFDHCTQSTLDKIWDKWKSSERR